MRDTNAAASVTPRPPSTAEQRECEMYLLRVTQGLTLRAIGERFDLSPERVRQLINRHVAKTTSRRPNHGAMGRAARAIRSAAEHGRAHAHAAELLAAWRSGERPEQIAGRLSMRVRYIREVIRANATDADRAVRSQARRSRGASRRRGVSV